MLCLDGTAGQVRGSRNSNVVLAYGLLDHSDPTKQVAFYDPGVGTFASSGAWTPLARGLSRLGGLVYGAGLRQNLGDAYGWLARTWQPGDRIFVFGFSRGAYTARALVGMLRLTGLTRPNSENLLPYGVSLYARRGGERRIDWDAVHRFAELFAERVDDDGHTTVPIEYLGVWDTVKAAGIAKWDIKWPYTRAVPNARHVRHAIAIDERRRPFREYVIEADSESLVEEAWFSGIHGDVGGGEKNTAAGSGRPAPSRGSKGESDVPGLSTIALRWVLEGALQHGLLVDEKAYRKAVAVSSEAATLAPHRNGRIWSVLVPRRRPVPAGVDVHASVRARMEARSDYRPKLPVDVTWVDEAWAGTESGDTESAALTRP
ncbi:DUF2235 domain-containing protein [Agromyces neolithicus]|uniref:DUF2235 domain-containing protein n=1 Tax=Agromyces neolithicus TaxID=269420 RepID=A0ABN2LVC1_9MICO